MESQHGVRTHVHRAHREDAGGTCAPAANEKTSTGEMGRGRGTTFLGGGSGCLMLGYVVYVCVCVGGGGAQGQMQQGWWRFW